jgi:hypothetical protein
LKTSIVKIYKDLSSIDTSLDISGGFRLKGVIEGLLDPLDRDIDLITAGGPILGPPKPSGPLLGSLEPSGPLLGSLEATRPFSGPTVPTGPILDPPEEPILGLPVLSIEGDPLEGSRKLDDIGPILGPIKSSLEGLGLTLPKEIDLL